MKRQLLRITLIILLTALILSSLTGCFGKKPSQEELSNFTGWKDTLNREWIQTQFNRGRLWSANNSFPGYWHDLVCFTEEDWNIVFEAWWEAVTFDYGTTTFDGAAYRIIDDGTVELTATLRYLDVSSIFAAGLEQWLRTLGTDAAAALQKLGYDRGNGAHQLFVQSVIEAIAKKNQSGRLDQMECQILLDHNHDYALANSLAIENLLTDSFVAWQDLSLEQTEKTIQKIYLELSTELPRQGIPLDPHLDTLFEAVEGISNRQEFEPMHR